MSDNKTAAELLKELRDRYLVEWNDLFGKVPSYETPQYRLYYAEMRSIRNAIVYCYERVEDSLTEDEKTKIKGILKAYEDHIAWYFD